MNVWLATLIFSLYSHIIVCSVSISIALSYNTKLRPLPCDVNDDIAIGSMLQTLVANMDVNGGLLENYAFTTFLCTPKPEKGLLNVRKLESPSSAQVPVRAPKGRKLVATRTPTRAPTVRPAWGWVIPGGGGCKLCNPDDGDLRADIVAEGSTVATTIPTTALPIDTSLMKTISPLESAIKAMETTLTNAIVAALLKNSFEIKCLKGATANVVVKVTLRDSLSTTPFGCVNR